MSSRRSPLIAVAVATCLALAACSSGKSALDSSDDADESAAATDAPDASSSDTSDTSDTSDATEDSESSGTVAPATTTTTPLADLPACPTDALAGADGPVDIVFWHGMTNELEPALVGLTDEYNASQDQVRVELQNQISYESTIDKYIAASPSSRPTLVQLPEYTVQEFSDSGTFVPSSACIESSGYDTEPIIPRTLGTYELEGVQWGMPFNVSDPVLIFNRTMFETAGLDPDDPPVSLEELREASQAIVDSGAASYGIALETGADSGGGWFLEQWFGRAGELYADNGNGRLARATEVLYDNELGAELLDFLKGMLDDGLAVNVGDNASGSDALFKLADQTEPAAMVISTSAALGTVFDALGGGTIPGLTADDVGVGPMPGPGDVPAVQVGGASLWIVADKDDAQTAAAWDYITYVTSAQSQSTWAAQTGYVPIREDALTLEPLQAKYADDPRFKVAYDQLVTGGNDVANTSPALGPMREVRAATANAVASVLDGADAAEALATAAEASDALIASYNARN